MQSIEAPQQELTIEEQAGRGGKAQEWEQAPEELVSGRLRRLGEGVGKVVYASAHWVVRRERSPSEVVALIVVWKLIRRLQRLMPGEYARQLLARPSGQIRAMRVAVQWSMAVLPRGWWMTTHVQQVWMMYQRARIRGEKLAGEYLAGSELVPARVSFPPVRVAIAGWPGWLVVNEATERVEATLYHRLEELSRQRRYEEVEEWLERFLELRQRGWQRGLFSLDAHLKNFGVSGDRVVLIDTGGLTNRWKEVEEKLAEEENRAASLKRPAPHVRLGLEGILEECPEVAERFNERWRATVNREVVGRYWKKKSEDRREETEVRRQKTEDRSPWR